MHTRESFIYNYHVLTTKSDTYIDSKKQYILINIRMSAYNV